MAQVIRYVDVIHNGKVITYEHFFILSNCRRAHIFFGLTSLDSFLS